MSTFLLIVTAVNNVSPRKASMCLKQCREQPCQGGDPPTKSRSVWTSLALMGTSTVSTSRSGTVIGDRLLVIVLRCSRMM
jgi:hypothetical protein